MRCSRSASTSRHCYNIATSIALSLLLLLIHHSHGSVEAKPPLRRARPALASPPPLPERDLQTDVSIPTFTPSLVGTFFPTISGSFPTSTPTFTCYDTPGWTDAYEESCDHYARYEEQECPNYGGTMGPANDNCCHCGGGSEIPPTVSPTLSGAPSSSSAPTIICYDTYNWTDAVGDGCDWYERNDDPGCPVKGTSYEGLMGVANDNCCYCGGGGTHHPTVSPTLSGAPSSSSAPTTCQDTPGWHDSTGYDCPWYEVMDDPGCPRYGDGNHTYGFDSVWGEANDNCCHCKNAIVHIVVSESVDTI
eukprot:scaffold3165_cov62-Cyclotella_meneghiniana.AAC.10